MRFDAGAGGEGSAGDGVDGCEGGDGDGVGGSMVDLGIQAVRIPQSLEIAVSFSW